MAFNRRIFSPQIWNWPAECWRSTIRPLRALMKQPDSRAKDLRARHLLSVIDALDWYVTNYDAIRRQFNSGQDRHPVHLPPGRRALTPCRAGQHVL